MCVCVGGGGGGAKTSQESGMREEGENTLIIDVLV